MHYEETFPVQLSELAHRYSSLPAVSQQSSASSIETLLHGPVDEMSIRFRHRKEILEKLATAALKKDYASTPHPDEIFNFISSCKKQHAYTATATIAAIAKARAGLLFDPTAFIRFREVDPMFWRLFRNFGRSSQPIDGFAPYALYELEKALGEPVHDLAAIRQHLQWKVA